MRVIKHTVSLTIKQRDTLGHNVDPEREAVLECNKQVTTN